MNPINKLVFEVEVVESLHSESLEAIAATFNMFLTRLRLYPENWVISQGSRTLVDLTSDEPMDQIDFELALDDIQTPGQMTMEQLHEWWDGPEETPP